MFRVSRVQGSGSSGFRAGLLSRGSGGFKVFVA